MMRAPTFSARSKVMLSLSIALAVLASGCSIEETTSIPDCERGDSGILVAQSVPTADLVPCFTSLPTGWEPDIVKICLLYTSPSPRDRS